MWEGICKPPYVSPFTFYDSKRISPGNGLVEEPPSLGYRDAEVRSVEIDQDGGVDRFDFAVEKKNTDVFIQGTISRSPKNTASTLM